MLKNALVEHCSPTLAGIKTGNMFSINNDSADIITEIRDLNRMITKRGLCLIPLKKSGKSTLIYLYRPDLLKRDLNLPEAEEILEKKGYPCGKTGCCITCLVRHFMEDEQFPHEIGLFLGYPPEDVSGFIKNGAQSFKCVGCWKVYGDADKAQKQFGRFKKCTKIYQKQYANGRPLTKLTVAK